MRLIDVGTSGSLPDKTEITWGDLDLPDTWKQIVDLFTPNTQPRPIQVQAIADHVILENRRNLIVSSPTNSGKSLVGYLVLLDAVRRNQRAVLLEPLRAIAQEKTDDLRVLAPSISRVLEQPMRVSISTGDYRLEHESLASPPPNQGELVIATPERLEAVLRNPEYDAWINSIGAVCVDEAHLIGSPRRGPTLEYLITYLLSLPVPPRIVLLSASLGDLEKASNWLSPCDVLQSSARQPPLHRTVVEVGPNENANAAVAQIAADVLTDLSANLLIFVYQTKSTEFLVQEIQSALGKSMGHESVLAYHGQMSQARRSKTRRSFTEGTCRCLVTTTALGLGVNLPATHVVIRDTTFAGSGTLDVADILQMMGRAGRGSRPGYAYVLIRSNDVWGASELASALKAERLTELRSSLSHMHEPQSRRLGHSVGSTDGLVEKVAALLCRREDVGFSLQQMQHFFRHSLGGQTLEDHVPSALAWLTDPLRVLAYQTEHGAYSLTTLGMKTTRAMLPLSLAAGYAQLIRDVLTIDPDDRLLATWAPLDHLVALDLLYENPLSLRRFSKQLVDQIDAWMEAHPNDIPLLYREWIAGHVAQSRAEEIIGSLGIRQSSAAAGTSEWAWKTAYMSIFRAIILLERGRGRSVEDLQRQWKIKNLEGIEERWRDNLLWLLSGIAQILDLRCFYYHLREGCSADFDRVKRVKHLLRRMCSQVYDLQELIKYCSPLGPALRALRQSHLTRGDQQVGIRTIRRLEEAGVTSIAQVAELQISELVDIGIRTDLAKQIRTYVRRRVQ